MEKQNLTALESKKLFVIASVRLSVQYRKSEQQLVLHNQRHPPAVNISRSSALKELIPAPTSSLFQHLKQHGLSLLIFKINLVHGLT
jgi:hypothetical protein